MKTIEFKNNSAPYISAEILNELQKNIGFYVVPIGGVVEYAGEVAPEGWLMCDGSAISRTEYADLFKIIGTTYGNGDGSSTFNLPDRRGRFGIGAGQGTPDINNDARFLSLGQKGGEYAHAISIGEMPSHYHDIESWLTTDPVGGVDKPLTYGMPADTSIFYSRTMDVGGGVAHNNVPPYLGMNYIIKY